MATRNHIPIPENLPADFWARFDARTHPNGECIEWHGRKFGSPVCGKRYGAMNLPRPDHRNIMVHRLAWARAFGTIPGEMLVLHRCDNPPCVNPAHLFLGTPADNMADRSRKGRAKAPKWEAHGLSKLTADAVTRIRAMIGVGAKHHDIARAFDVCRATVSQIARGARWAP